MRVCRLLRKTKTDFTRIKNKINSLAGIVNFLYSVAMDKKNYNFPILIEKDDNGFFAMCPDLQGCYSQGDTYEEALANIEDAIKLHVEDRLEEKETFAEPRSVMFLNLRVAI